MKKSLLLGIIIVLSNPFSSYAQHTPLSSFRPVKLGAATCKATDSTLTISSGTITRIYKLTSRGFMTTHLRFKNNTTGLTNHRNKQADWDLGTIGKAKLISIVAKIDDDSGFTSNHIDVTSEFQYPDAGLELLYKIWIYPESGIRTQIELRLMRKEQSINMQFSRKETENIPIQIDHSPITAFGYYNNTERRNEDSTPILKEEQVSPNSFLDWASGLMMQNKNGGLIMVKESHKCVNQPGIATGGFEIDSDKIAITGLGLDMTDLDTLHYTSCWANWIIPYTGDSTYGMLALKKFDRMRYPVKQNDVYIMANTWGTGNGRYAARQENVLNEITTQSGLGIDVQQIDDGWQDKNWRPVISKPLNASANSSDQTKYDVYPDGWNTVKRYASQKGTTLGLWAAWQIPEKDLIWNYNHGGFKYFKLDGSYIDTKKKLDDFMNKVRLFILYTRHQARVNLDVTENSPRFGYFYGREYGNIFLENREPHSGSYAFITYRPHLVLRDAWQLAKYTNLNKFQIPIQRIDDVNRQESEAYLYNNLYSVAIALMGSPIFFEETHLYSQKDRERIRNVLEIYKHYRNEIYKGYVFPIGNEPDNASWTGFQDMISHGGTGYLMLFRELHNAKNVMDIQLKFIHNRFIEVTNLMTGGKKKLFVNDKGFAKFVITKPADFRFYRYKIISATQTSDGINTVK